MSDWIAAIKARHSVRRYSDMPLSDTVLASLREAIEAIEPLNEGLVVNLWLLPFAELKKRSAVGAVVLLNAAPWYLIAQAPQAPGRMEEVGFRMEQVILAATSLGLGTCWIGGMFRSGVLARRLDCPPEEIVAISPVGWPEGGQKQRASYAVIEFLAARRGERKPLSEIAFSPTWGHPLDENSLPHDILTSLELARIAPSWSNVQPWYFVVSESEVYALADSRPQRGNDRPGKPYYRLDTGIAMAHFWLAMRQLGHSERWRSALGKEDSIRAAIAAPDYALPIGKYRLSF